MSSQNARIRIPRRELIVGATALAGSTLVSAAHADEDLVVIVNESNDEVPSRSQLAAMFTTRMRSWGDGKRVLPFNFPARDEVRVAFDRAVLNMNPDEVARYWIDRRIRGGNAPPKQIPNAHLIVRLVQKLDGAVAYAPRSIAHGVRIVDRI